MGADKGSNGKPLPHQILTRGGGRELLWVPSPDEGQAADDFVIVVSE